MPLFIRQKQGWRGATCPSGSVSGIASISVLNRWSKLGLWENIFALTADPDPLIIAIDSTSIRANQVASGVKKRSGNQVVWVVHEED